jgi:N-acetylneuraminic acid mutarotase
MWALGSRAGFRILFLIAFFAISLCSEAQSTAPNEWAWMGGSGTLANRPGVYGTLGSPAAANMPGSRNGAASWTDKNGNLWLFGGGGADSAGNGGNLNDLWEFDSSSREWAWMSGSSVLSSWSCGGQVCGGQSGVYGTLGMPAPEDVPGGRAFAASWTDSNGNLWLFGGYGPISTGKTGYFNDLWKYSPSAQEWTWMGGSSTGPTAGGPAGVYGTLGKPSSANVPGARYQAASWTGKDGNLWLFGGYGFDAAGSLNPLNDLWEFNPSTSQWTWMGGSSTAASQNGRAGTYGTLGIPAAGNYPGSRYQANAWTDQSGNLWLFGGTGTDSVGNFSVLNDLWEFNPTTQQWAWMTGSKVIVCAPKSCGEPATYGSLGVPGAENSPGGRAGATASTDSDGNFWLFGGWGNDHSIRGNGYLNDLWEFSPSTQEWAWRSGSNSLGQDSAPQRGVYGTLGASGLSSVPGGREWAASWIDNSGNYWLFGGFGANSVRRSAES